MPLAGTMYNAHIRAGIELSEETIAHSPYAAFVMNFLVEVDKGDQGLSSTNLVTAIVLQVQ